MKLNPPITVTEISKIIDCEILGDSKTLVKGLNEIHKVVEGDLMFVDHPKYYEKAIKSKATVIIANEKLDIPKGKVLLFSENPFKDYNKLISNFFHFNPQKQYYHHSVKVGANTVIQPGVFLGENVKIGKNCLIHPNVVINSYSEIGDNVIIHPNTTIGSDAFYYNRPNGSYQKMISCGKVIIDSNVEIGANCTVDRGVSGDTIIGAGTKLDNQVHIGHDTVIGKNCLFAAQVGIAGAVTIEDDVVFWGQVGVISGVKIGKGAVILAQSGVANSLEGGKEYFGSPALEANAKKREIILLRNLLNSK